MTETRARVFVIPCTTPVANEFVKALHRHHGVIPPGFAWWCCAAVVAGTIRGVAIAGRPTNRNNDDRQTVEVLRLASDGTPNVPSALLGACARAAEALGAARIITYTLEEEGGASIRGAGWTCTKTGIRSWWTSGQSRGKAIDRPHMGKPKVRWEKRFRDPLVVCFPDMHGSSCDLDADCSTSFDFTEAT